MKASGKDEDVLVRSQLNVQQQKKLQLRKRTYTATRSQWKAKQVIFLPNLAMV